MPRTTLAPAIIGSAGMVITRAAVDQVNGNQFRNNGKQYLSIKNADSADHTVTINAFPAGAVGTPPDGLAVTDRVITVALGTEVDVGPFEVPIYCDANGMVQVDWSAATGMTVQVRQFTPNAG